MADGHGGEDLIAWAREVRGAETLNADNGTLQAIQTFFWEHEEEAARDSSHVVLEHYPDWWTRGRKAPPGLTIETEEDLDLLFQHAGALFDLGIPLTLAERRSTQFRLFQDVEAWGSRETSMAAEDFLGPECAFADALGRAMAEIYPGCEFLDLAVYDATGVSQTKGLKKTSLRLVWPGVVVDSERAGRIRDLLVHRLSAAAGHAGSPVAVLQERLLEISVNNTWHNVISDAAYSSRAGMRMPLCDRVSPLPLRAPEQRPFKPAGVLRFTYGCGEEKMRKEWICGPGELESAEWLKIGCLRQPAGTPLTEWQVPSWQRSKAMQPNPAGRGGGRVRVRTAGGSPGSERPLRASQQIGMGGPAPAPERAGQLLTVERHFDGEVDQFCVKMGQHLGQATEEADGSVVWQQAGGARVIMRVGEKKVLLVGRPNQVRSLIVVVQPFTEAMGVHSGDQHQSVHSGAIARPPSQAYAPAPASVAAAAETAPQGGEAAAPSAAQAGASAPSLGLPQSERARVANIAFQAESQGELTLAVGDEVVVTHDPEGERGSGADRWVYGRNATGGQLGWFPLSHTAAKGV